MMAKRGVVALSLAGLVFSLMIAAFLAPFASESPDGLERIALDQEFSHFAEGTPPAWKDSPFPDYQMPRVRSDGLATSLAGIAGTTVVLFMGFGVAILIRSRGRMRKD